MNFIVHGNYPNGCSTKLMFSALSIGHVFRLFNALHPDITIVEVEELHDK